MKSKKNLLLICFFVVGCGFLVLSGYKSLQPQGDGLSDYVVGTWVNKVPQSSLDSIDNSYYQLEFQKPGKLILNRVDGKQPLNNLLLYYEVDEVGQMIMTGRERGIFRISRDEEDLIIQSEVFSNLAGRYQRKPTIEWSAVAFLLALVIFWLGSASISRFLPAIEKSRGNLILKNRIGKMRLIILILFAAIAFYLGWKISDPLWRFPLITMIRLPWDAIISIELSLFMILPILWILYGLNGKFQNNQFLINMIIANAGSLLFGMCLNGLFLGIMKLLILVIVGSYPQ
ncbi:hypothetical protein [Levilinea saccharolytica]|uniref:Uncharacterized protein n=1 Tax=Levilinea saccharolytica TaxID=229921 RepID=A0A0P6YSK0_9CHLR|nr:hypothetical protein [Levilinea saccharolytica]KPL88075.1 hypothetical protein ADN01_04030 [Levilinea saccharolytica]GAP18558.1 hypothetical protein LSAC_02454 [Levilinea saccharolytica]